MSALPPGPRAPGAVQAALWALRYPEFTASARRRFGETYSVRLGTMAPAVVTTNADLIRVLLTGDPMKRPAVNDVVKPLIADRSVLQLPPAEHLTRRRLLLPPFHGDAIQVYAELIGDLVDAELSRWAPGEPVVTLEVAERVTLEVIMQAVLGVRDPALRAHLRELIDDLFGYPVIPVRRRLPGAGRRVVARVPAGHTALTDLLALTTPAVMTYFPGMKARSRWNLLTRPFFTLYDRLLAVFDEHIARTRADPDLARRTDILAMLIQAEDEAGNRLGNADLRDELFALVSAGHETTATTIAWAMDYLAHDDAARASAREAAAAGDTDYLRAVTRETLRLQPPIPIASHRSLADPFAVGDWEIPAATPIFIDALGLHTDPRNYAEPLRFDPHRFAKPSEQPPRTWLPFGGGAHRCIGAALAELEVAITLERILRSTDFAAADPRPAQPIRRALVHVPSGAGTVVPV